jgi:4-hydroxy-tetrahydrodipicolinate reductase
VDEVAVERGHRTTVLTEIENANGSWLAPGNLQDTDAVIDFTTPDAVLPNIARCIASKTPMVVGTTGWYGELGRIKQEVERAGVGFIFGANFSYGVNLFLQIARAAAPALQHGYAGRITERHHIQKKDAPSGTAVALQRVVEQASGVR